MRRLLQRLPRATHPLLVVLMSYQLLMALLIILFYPKIVMGGWWLLFHLAVIALLLGPDGKWGRMLKPWSPIAILPMNFTELHYLVYSVHPRDFDVMLLQWDYTLFGTHPTLWLEQFTWPLLTEVLQWIYAAFYFFPIILAARLFLKGKMEAFYFVAFQIVYGFYLSYMGYFVIPAVGPRFILTDIQTIGLHGVWLRESIDHLLSTLEQRQHDAFPSGHTMITVMTLWYGWKFDKQYFYVAALPGLLLIYSTVYLRYHYFVDVATGLALAVVAVISGQKLYNYLSGRKT